MLPAAHAQSLLPEFTFRRVQLPRERYHQPSDDLAVKPLYLGHLCARGDIVEVRNFLQEIDPDDLEQILNAAPHEQWYGTCLHMVTYWNTGDKAIELFKLLVLHGAKPVEDYYGYFPWDMLRSLYQESSL